MNLALIFAATIVDNKTPGSLMTPEHYARLQRGLELYWQGRVDRLVVTSSHELARPHEGKRFYQHSVDWLTERGVPREHILVVPHSRLTIEETAGMHKIMREVKPKEVHLISSDWHLPRASAMFRTAYPRTMVFDSVIETGKPIEPQGKIFRDVRNMRKFRRKVSEGKIR